MPMAMLHKLKLKKKTEIKNTIKNCVARDKNKYIIKHFLFYAGLKTQLFKTVPKYF